MIASCSGESSRLILPCHARELVGVGVVADALGHVDAAAGDAERSRLHRSPARRATGSDSPVRIDSSTCSPRASSSRPSATTWSPGARRSRRRRRRRRRPRALVAVAQHARARRGEQRELVERPLRAQLLHDADARVDDQHAEEEQVGQLAGGDQRDRAGREDEVEEREQVAPDDRPVAEAAGRRLCRSPLLEPARRLGRAETVRRHSRQPRDSAARGAPPLAARQLCRGHVEPGAGRARCARARAAAPSRDGRGRPLRAARRCGCGARLRALGTRSVSRSCARCSRRSSCSWWRARCRARWRCGAPRSPSAS